MRSLKLLGSLSFFVLISSVTLGQSLGPNDISILFPLPTSLEQSELLKASTQGHFGELLPASFFAKIPNLTFGPGSHPTVIENMRVVALRLDPCFPEAESPLPCQAQIRLVWQPLEKDSSGELQAVDAALHSFYPLKPGELAVILRELKTLKQSQTQPEIGPLGIQPDLLRENMRGPFTQGLLTLIKRYTGEQRLSRITFMRLSGLGKMWTFGGFDIQNQEMKKMAIPRIKGNEQFIVNIAEDPSYFDGNLSPAPQGKDTFNSLMRRSEDLGPAQMETVKEETLATFRIENPLLHNPNTLDCVSCHTAQSARLWSTRNFPEIDWEQRAGADRYISRFPLENKSPHPGHTSLFRAFGYEGRDPAISQRVINETAAALELILNAKEP